MEVAVIGAGAAGCFCAIEIKRRSPETGVTIYEAGPRPLAKLALTGGGRCNFTNSFEDIRKLSEAYPRGERLMKKALGTFGWKDTIDWFRKEGVPSVIQEDHCVFPRSQDAMQVVRTLENLLRRLGVKVICGRRIGSLDELQADALVLTAGGTSAEKLRALLPADVSVTPTVPSLYTFKIDDSGLRALMGTVCENATASLAGTKFKASGPLLITDWGVSGPAVLKLSSYAARQLAENGFRANLLVNWTGADDTSSLQMLSRLAAASPKRQVSATPPEGVSARLWKHLLEKSGLREDLRWGEMGSKGAARLTAALTCDNYQVTGRAKFKEEFVTCGGVDLSGVNPATMESRTHPGLFFAGEVLDIDGITGGFNLQAAWSTAIVAARGIESKIKNML